MPGHPHARLRLLPQQAGVAVVPPSLPRTLAGERLGTCSARAVPTGFPRSALPLPLRGPSQSPPRARHPRAVRMVLQGSTHASAPSGGRLVRQMFLSGPHIQAGPIQSGGPRSEKRASDRCFLPRSSELAAPPPARTTPATPAPSACIAKRDMREAERVALPHRAASSSRHLHGPPFDDHREPGGLEGRGRHARVPPDLRQLRRNCLRGRGHVLRARDPGKHLGLVRVRACSRCPPRWCCCSCGRGLAGDAVPLRRRGNPCRGRVPWRARRPAGRAWGSGCPDSAEAVLLHNVTNVAARSDAQQGPRSRRVHEAGTPERRTMQMHR